MTATLSHWAITILAVLAAIVISAVVASYLRNSEVEKLHDEVAKLHVRLDTLSGLTREDVPPGGDLAVHRHTDTQPAMRAVRPGEVSHDTISTKDVIARLHAERLLSGEGDS